MFNTMKENPNIIKDLGMEVFNGKIIVRQAKVESKVIFLPQGNSADVQKAEGYILALASDVENFEVGNYIAYGKYASWELPEGEEENLYIVDCGDVLYRKNAPKEDTK